MIRCAMLRWVVAESIVQRVDGLLVIRDQTLHAHQCTQAEPDLCHKRRYLGGMRSVMIGKALAGWNLNYARADEQFTKWTFRLSPRTFTGVYPHLPVLKSPSPRPLF